MNSEYLKIKDECRNNLSRFTIQAYSLIPEIDSPVILDIGCGSGVTTIALIEKCNGIIYAVDPDLPSIKRLKEKVSELNLNDRIKVFNDSIFNPDLFIHKFDIVLAEGLLNMIGFKTGLPFLTGHVKKNGYIIIHDELKDDSEKKKFFKSRKLKLLGSFILDKEIWWNNYYGCLEKKIRSINNDNLFENELNEIKGYKLNPMNYRSIYYILQN